MVQRKAWKRPHPTGPRGVAMIALAVLALGRAIAYLQPSSPQFTPAVLLNLEPYIPTISWGILWGAAGLLILVSAFMSRAALALGVMAGVTTLWALVYMWAAFTRSGVAGFEDSIGSWITASVYLAIAIIAMLLPYMSAKWGRADG